MIANKYRIIEKLNEGSFGQIFKAENIRTKELVAIKVESKTNQTNKYCNTIYKHIKYKTIYSKLCNSFCNIIYCIKRSIYIIRVW